VKRKIRSRFSLRQARSIVLVGLGLGLVLSCLQIGLDLAKEKRQIEQAVKHSIETVKGQAVQAAFSIDRALAAKVLDGLFQYRPIRQGMVVDDFGTVLARRERPAAQGSLDWLAGLVFKGDLRYTVSLHSEQGSRLVGHLEVVVDDYLVARHFVDRSIIVLAANFLYALALTVALTWLSYRTLTKPLLETVRGLSAVDPASPAEKLLEIPRSHEDDELGLLAITANNLLESFDQSLKRCLIAESRTLEREARLRAIMESVPEGVLTIDEKGLVEGCNPAAEGLFGLKERMLEGTAIFDLLMEKPGGGGTFRQALKDCLESGGASRLPRHPCEVELRRIGKEGLPVELRLGDLHFKERRLVVCVIHDISWRKEAEKEKQRLQEQLIQAQKMEAVGTLAGGIAHDFNNLLQAVHGYAELLLMDREEKERGYSELYEIARFARKGGDLTRQLLTFSRKMESELRPVDLNRRIQKFQDLLSRSLPDNVGIDLELAPDLKLVNADPAQMEQVVMNLVLNARDAMPGGGRMTISTRNVVFDEDVRGGREGLAAGEYVALSVSDTGHGIRGEHLDHIFEPFFTLKEAGKGVGLGLAMVYGIVESHGGRIDCSSLPGQGATFVIHIPAMNDGKDSLKSPQVPPKLPMGGGTVLLVDDEAFIRDLGAQILARFGYKVLTAPDGERAVDIYERQGSRIDAVVLDLLMPRMDGGQCLERLLALNPDVKIIVASGHYPRADDPLASSIKTKAKRFIRKPYEARQLLTAVREVMDSSDE